MNRLLALLTLVFSGLSAPVVDVVPELEQALQVIQLEEVHKLGYTGEGVTVLVIDRWPSGHARRVVEMMRAVAPDVSIIQADVEQGFSRAFASAERNLGNFQLINMSVVMEDSGSGALLSSLPCPELKFSDQDVITMLTQQGVTLIGAAGNDSHSNALASPSCHPDVISVGASYDEALWEPDPFCEDTLFILDHLTCFSNESLFLDIVAPGRTLRLPDGGLFDGTSASAPLVTGAAALMLQANPDLTSEDIRNLLASTGDTAQSPRTGRSYPRLNVLAAVREAIRQADTSVPVGQPPEIVSFGAPDFVFVDTPVPGALHFKDPDGDIRAIQFEQQTTSSGKSHSKQIPFVQPFTFEDTVEVEISCQLPGLTHDRITLIDKAGNRSKSFGYQFECLPSIPFLMRAERQKIINYDQNLNDVLDDDEVKSAVQDWISGQLFTDGHAADRLIFKLIQLWVQQTPLHLI